MEYYSGSGETTTGQLEKSFLNKVEYLLSVSGEQQNWPLHCVVNMTLSNFKNYVATYLT